jgi:hypothetical protein
LSIYPPFFEIITGVVFGGQVNNQQTDELVAEFLKNEVESCGAPAILVLESTFLQIDIAKERISFL